MTHIDPMAIACTACCRGEVPRPAAVTGHGGSTSIPPDVRFRSASSSARARERRLIRLTSRCERQLEAPSGGFAITRIAILVAALVVPLAAAPAENPTVNVYNWSNHIDEETLPEFESETGISVTYDVYDSDAVLEPKLKGETTGYDIVVPSGSFLARQIQTGAFQELEKGLLGNLANLERVWH